MASVPAPSATASAMLCVLPLWDQKTTATLLMESSSGSGALLRVDLFAVTNLAEMPMC